MLPKVKALLEGGQQLYTKNATAQVRVSIKIRTEYSNRKHSFQEYRRFLLVDTLSHNNP